MKPCEMTEQEKGEKKESFVPEVSKHRAGDSLAVDLLHPAHHLEHRNQYIRTKQSHHRHHCCLSIWMVRRNTNQAITTQMARSNQSRPGALCISPCTCELLGRRHQLLQVQSPPRLHLQSPLSAAPAPETCFGNLLTRDWNTWSRLLNISTILASFERPSTLPQGVYSPRYKWIGLCMEHLATRKITDGNVAHEGDQVVLAQAR